MSLERLNYVDKSYLGLAKEILENGCDKGDRTGTGTKSVFGRMLKYDLSKGFPLLTTKKMHFKGIVHELLWFIKGDTNIKYLVDNNIKIWNGNAYDYYKQKISKYPEIPTLSMDEFIETIKLGDLQTNVPDYKLGDLGSVYGKQWRRWETNERIPLQKVQSEHGSYYEYGNKSIDQLKNAIDTLKTSPDSRRIIVNSWNVAEMDDMALPPCHLMYQLYSQELTNKERYELANQMIKESDQSLFPLVTKILPTKNGNMLDYEGIQKSIDSLPFDVPKRKLSLAWTQRSVDFFLGKPYNIASYALLLHMITQVTKHAVGELTAFMGDCHIYSNHISQMQEQMSKGENGEVYELSTLKLNKEILDIDSFTFEDITLENYQSHNVIKAKMAV